MEDKITVSYYNENAREFIKNTWDADMSEVYSHFLKYIQPGGHILDAGCGSGRDSFWFLQRGYQVTAADASEEMCRAAEKLIRQPVLQRSFKNMNFQGEFDGIWACASLLHVKKEDLPEILKKMMNALKSGGVLYASWKYGTSERTSGGRYFCDLTREELLRLLSEQEKYRVEDCWITEDARADHNEKWLNAVIRRNEEDCSPFSPERH